MPLFGTDGIRGEAGRFPLDAATLPRIGRALGECLGGPVLMARDTRRSGPGILALLRAGLLECGVRVEDAGVLPTPALALLTRQAAFRGGIMVTASHNPFQDNGIKVFGREGHKLEDAAEAAIEQRVAELKSAAAEPGTDAPADGATPPRRWLRRYLDSVRTRFADGPWLQGLKVTVDCGHGAMSRAAPECLASLGAVVDAIHAAPDGTNINAASGALHPESLIEAVRRRGSDLGAAFDGDGDRAVFVSGAGRLFDGDAVLLVLARLMKRAGALEPAVVVGTSMTNYALERALEREDIELVRAGVGDRRVLEAMRAHAALLGGEPSGHIIFSDHPVSGDGLLTTLKLCEAMVSANASLDALTADWKPAPQLFRNLPVADRVPLDTLPAVGRKIEEVRRRLRDRGRIVVRYSGTEPLLRIMVESDSRALNADCADELSAVVIDALHRTGDTPPTERSPTGK